MNNQIMVSICCVTYNHEKYIRDAIEGFLMQKTTFPIEILIHDDASTDGTADIIREYEKKYPDLIKPIYQTENQYSKGIKIFATYHYPRAKGKYIALCEGDDYWTDPYKLQKQVDFLEENPEYVLCFHNVSILNDSNGVIMSDYITREVPDTTNIYELAKGNYIHTPSVVFRNGLVKIFPKELSKSPVGDYFLYMIVAQHGLIKKLRENMAIYRIHKGGVWSQNNNKTPQIITMLKLLIRYFKGKDFNKILIRRRNLLILNNLRLVKLLKKIKRFLK